MSSFNHSFSVDYAEKFGIECAILITHFQYWIRHNQKLKRNLHDGRTWMYQTQQEISAHFPYWNRESVNYHIDKLVKLGILKKGNYNKTQFDKTLWYAFENEEMFTKGQNCPIDRANVSNPMGESDQPIPDTKPDAIQEQQQQQPLTPLEKVVVVVVEDSKEKEKNKAIEFKEYLDEFSIKYKPCFKIPLSIIQTLISKFGIKYVKDQIIYMCAQETKADEDEKSSKIKKTKRVDNPKSFLSLACEGNWALSNHKKN